jgi:succinate dehydrogenase / fumarate reductase, cytochrome b subunit
MSTPAEAPIKRARPLSPHLQIYKPQLTSMTSILHRLTGLAMAIASILLVGLLGALTMGPESFEQAKVIAAHPAAIIVFILWSWGLFYHLFNGIRHLAWDAGAGFDIKVAYRTGYIVLIGSVLVTIALWGNIFGFWG